MYVSACASFKTLGAHARGLLCLSVYPSVPALAASASVEKPANNGTHGFLLGFSWIYMWKKHGVEKPIL